MRGRLARPLAWAATHFNCAQRHPRTRKGFRAGAVSSRTFWTLAAFVIPFMIIVASCRQAGGSQGLAASAVVAVVRANIPDVIQTQGTLRFNQQASLSFDQAGTLHRILVGAGDRVREGQLLAATDNAGLLRDIAKIEAELDAARISAREEPKDLDYLVALTKAMEAVAKAELGVEEAYLELALATAPATEETAAKAAQAVAEAIVAVIAAQRDLEMDQATFGPSGISQAEAVVEEAQQVLGNLRSSSAQESTDASQEVERALSRLATAEIAYRTAVRKLYGIELPLGIALSPPAELHSTFGYSLPIAAVGDAALPLSAAAAFIQLGIEWPPGSGTPPTVLNAPAPEGIEALNQPWDAVTLAQLGVDRATSGAMASASATRESIDKAVASAKETEERLNTLLAGPDESALALKEAKLLLAGVNLRAAKRQAESLQSGPNPILQRVQEARLRQAEATLAKAHSELAHVEAAARTSLAQRIEKLEINLTDAQEELAGTFVRAPFDGTIASVHVNPGDRLSRGELVAVIVDTNGFHVETFVIKEQVRRVREGQRTWVTLEGDATLRISGTVESIALVANRSSMGDTFTVRIALDPPDSGPTLRDGFSAQVSIVVAPPKDALVVPTSAVYESRTGQAVRVLMVDGSIVERRVRLGIKDGEQVEVLAGVVEGERVLTPVTTPDNTGRE